MSLTVSVLIVIEYKSFILIVITQLDLLCNLDLYCICNLE